MKLKIVVCTAMLALLSVAPFVARLSAQTTGQQKLPLLISSMSGRDLFRFYCASCHGLDGKGKGPVASALTVPPSDLTAIAKQHGGTFSKAGVESFVTGEPDRLTPAHGSKDMPVWGPIFRGLDPNDTVNKVRIANVVGYIESIQEAK